MKNIYHGRLLTSVFWGGSDSDWTKFSSMITKQKMKIWFNTHFDNKILHNIMESTLESNIL